MLIFGWGCSTPLTHNYNSKLTRFIIQKILQICNHLTIYMLHVAWNGFNDKMPRGHLISKVSCSSSKTLKKGGFKEKHVRCGPCLGCQKRQKSRKRVCFLRLIKIRDKGIFFTYYKHGIRGWFFHPYPWSGYDILPNLKFPSFRVWKICQNPCLGWLLESTQNPSLGAILKHDIHLRIPPLTR